MITLIDNADRNTEALARGIAALAGTGGTLYVAGDGPIHQIHLPSSVKIVGRRDGIARRALRALYDHMQNLFVRDGLHQ